jgi:hypothetical protein
VETKTIQIESGKRVDLEVGTKMSTSGANAVHFTISGANSDTFTKTIYNIKAFELSLEQDNNSFTNYDIYEKSFTYYVNAKGQIAKSLFVSIDNNTPTIISLGATDNLAYPVPIDCNDLLAGVHTLTTYLMANGVYSKPITTDFIYHPAGTTDAIYALVAKYPTSI